MADEPLDVWLSGTENIRLISDMLDPWKLPDMRERQTGRTKKLALSYAMLCLKTPFHRVIIKDHEDSLYAAQELHRHVLKILDALNVDYKTGRCTVFEREDWNPSEPTPGHTRFYVIAEPVMRR